MTVSARGGEVDIATSTSGVELEVDSSGVADDDLVLLWVCADGGHLADIELPAGFVELAAWDGGLFGEHARLGWRYASGEPSTYTVGRADNGADVIAILVPLIGAHPDGPTLVATPTSNSGPGAAITANGVTPNVDDGMVVAAFAGAQPLGETTIGWLGSDLQTLYAGGATTHSAAVGVLPTDDADEGVPSGRLTASTSFAMASGHRVGVTVFVPGAGTDPPAAAFESLGPYVPNVVIEVAPGAGPYDDVFDDQWVRVDGDAFSVSTEIGRSSEFDEFPPGTATVELVNDCRQWDPLYEDGPYFGQLVADMPLRVRAELPDGIRDVWRGFVDGWPAGYREGGFRSEVTLGCTDAFKILAQRNLPRSVYEAAVLADDPFVLWPLDESQGAVAIDRGPNHIDGASNPANSSAQTALRIESVGAASFDETPGAAILVPRRAEIEALPFTVEAWFARTPGAVSSILIAQGGDDGGGFQVDFDGPVTIDGVSCTTIGVVFGFGADERHASVLLDADPAIPRHLVVVVDAAEDVAVYVDGVQLHTAAPSGGSAPSGPPVTAIGDWPGVANPWSGNLSDVALYEAELDAGQVAVHHAAGAAAWAGDTTGQRIERVLDLIGWPAALRAIDRGETILGPALLGGQPALTYLQTLAATEQGRLFVDQAGRVTFHDRARVTAETTPAYTFTDVVHATLLTRPDAGIVDESLSITVDDQYVFDAATVTREGGIPQTVAATATPVRSRDVAGLLFRDDVQARSLAQWVVFRYQAPQPRVDSWSVDPQERPDDWGQILDLGIGSRIAHSVTPGQIGDPVVLELLVEQVAHSVSQEDGSWVIGMHGSPVDPAAYLLWGAAEVEDAEHGWLDAGPETGGVWG